MRSEYPPLDINLVFPGLEDYEIQRSSIDESEIQRSSIDGTGKLYELIFSEFIRLLLKLVSAILYENRIIFIIVVVIIIIIIIIIIIMSFDSFRTGTF